MAHHLLKGKTGVNKRSFRSKFIFFFCLNTIISLYIFGREIPWYTNEIISGGRIDAIAYAGNNIVICGTRNPNPGWIFYSIDNGFTWAKGQRLDSSEPLIGITNIACTGNGLCFALNESSELFRSNDFGKTWERINKISPNRRLINQKYNQALSYGLCITKQGNLLVSDTNEQGGYIFRSTDNGITFTSIGPISSAALYRFELVRNGIIVNGWGGSIYKSEDDGQSWKLWSRMDTTTALYATEYIRPATIIQASENGDIYRCNADKASLNSIHVGNPGNGDAADDFVYLGYHTLIYTTYTGAKHIYISYDEGKNWIDDGPVPTGAKGDWLDHVIAIEQEDSVIVVGGTNKGFIVRTSFSRGDLFAKSVNLEKDQIPISLKGNLEKGLLGSLFDPFELDEPEDVLIDGNFAYIPCRGSNNLAVIDISDSRNPVLTSSFRDPDLIDAMGVSKHGKYIYIASFSNRTCLVVDASNPKKLKKLYAFKVGPGGSGADQLRKVVYHEGYLYLTHDDESKLYIADASNPERPKVISSVKTGNDGAFAVFVKGNYAYTGGCFPANGLVGISTRVVDISDKMNPRLVTSLIDSTKYGCICDFKLESNRYLVKVGWLSNSISVLDISKPDSPVEIGYLKSDQIDHFNRLAIIGNKAYTISSTTHSFAQIDISSLEQPIVDYIVPSWKLQKAYGLDAKDGLLYIAGRDSRFFLIVDPSKY